VALRFLAAALICMNRPQEAQAAIDRLLSAQPNASIRRLSHFIGKGDRWVAFITALKAAGLPE
jgi:hypothetical protein